VQLGITPDGNPLRPHVAGKNRAEVKRKRDDLVARHRAGAVVDPAAERQRLGAYLRSWLDGKRSAVEPATFAAYRFQVERCLLPLLGHLPLGALRPDDVRRAYAALVLPPHALAPRTLHHVHVRLKQALGQAVREGTLPRNVALLVDAPKVPRAEVAALVAEGLSNRDLAARLVITERTGENHVAHILNRLGLRSRVQIATWVTERDVRRAAETTALVLQGTAARRWATIRTAPPPPVRGGTLRTRYPTATARAPRPQARPRDRLTGCRL
jgi:DNA-binding CsgD family transcriptional regulator